MVLRTGEHCHVYHGRNGSSTFLHWLATVRASRVICILLIIIVTITVITHQYISSLASEIGEGQNIPQRKLNVVEEVPNAKIADLKFRIDELKRIKASVSNELRELESKRQKLHADISYLNTDIDKLNGNKQRMATELTQLRLSLDNAKIEHEEFTKQNMPRVLAPKRILPSLADSQNVAPPKKHQKCRLHNCFDYSRCSLTSQFPVYFYNVDEYSLTNIEIDAFIKSSVTQALHASPHVTFDPHIACIYILLVGDADVKQLNRTDFEARLQKLPYWNGDGRNHILLNVARTYSNSDLFRDVNTHRAMVAQSVYLEHQYRPKFDMLIPPSLGISHGQVWDQLPTISPARRKYLMTFQGQAALPSISAHHSDTPETVVAVDGRQGLPVQVAPLPQAEGGIAKNGEGSFVKNVNNNGVPDAANGNKGRILLERFSQNKAANKDVAQPAAASRRLLHSLGNRDSDDSHTSEMKELLSLESQIVATLKKMQQEYASDNFMFEFSCSADNKVRGVNSEWMICGADSSRHQLLQQSTFALIIAPTNFSILSTTLLQTRLYEALKYGAVPVILGDHLKLPFEDFLDWKQAVLTVPKARITELHMYISTFSDSDILELRRQGRIFWEMYFGSTKHIVDTLLAVMRARLSIPAFPIREEPSPSVFKPGFTPLKDPDVEPPAENEDVLGPVEPPVPSLRYLHNFSVGTQMTFNQPGDPFHLYPFTPFQPPLPAEARFLGSGYGFRPIGKGAGGAGKEFREALGGNYPREQFTVVILTYEREAVLINALQRLKGLPHLNKVVVVWNSPKPPNEEIKWPDIGVEVHVVKTSKNSLNNRFLPYDVIETEAILSIDDDAHLRHDEIIFGFRVWREARDRIVGFPARFHAWDAKFDSWLYNSNYSCELSMVLTGAAFFHKYYAYLYSYVMPQAIREKVDEYLNCEDLAMNFLVSHITRKPPIKVTSRWTFRCPGCPQALSVDTSHFHERHKCINFFTKVYGYMPLLNTQFRADSILFKTRIPHDKQKCFRFI